MKTKSCLLQLNGLSVPAKTGMVLGGYVAAFVLASWVLAIYVDQTSGSDRDASQGMYAFGDGMLFVFVLGAASTLPTCLALLFLRRASTFWLILAIAALAVSATGVAAVAAIADPGVSVRIGIWGALAVPRIFVAPLLASLFALCGWLSPDAGNRRRLIAAAGIECATGIYGFVHWFVPLILSAAAPGPWRP